MKIYPQVDRGLIKNNIPKIGILSLGKMGSSIVKSLSEKAIFYTSTEGRSRKTLDSAHACTVEVLPSIKDVFNNVDIFFCIGTRGISKETIQSAIKYEYKNIYVDLNTLFGRESEQELYQMAENKLFHFVDGVIYGWPPNTDKGEEPLYKTSVYLFNDLNQIVYNLFQNKYWTPQELNTPAKRYRRVNLS